MKSSDVWTLVVLVVLGVISWAYLYSTIKSDIVNSLHKCCVECECERGK